MGKFKGRKIRGVILFCFVLSAFYGNPVKAIKNNPFTLVPISKANNLSLFGPINNDNHTYYESSDIKNSAISLAAELPFSLKNVSSAKNIAQINSSDFNILQISATSVCRGAVSVVKIESTSADLPDGTYSITYNLSGTNSSPSETSAMVVVNGTGTFNTIPLSNPGSTTITIVDGLVSGGNTTVIINVSDKAPIVAIGASMPAICMGEVSGSLGASVDGDATISWSSEGNIGTFSNISDPNAKWTPPALFTGSIILTLTATNSCGTDSESKTIEVKPLPIIKIESATGPICQGGSSEIKGSVGGSATGVKWTSSVGGTFSPSATALDVTWIPPANYSGTATLKLTSTGSSCEVYDTKFVIVDPKSVGGTANATISTVCSGGNSTLSLSGYVGTIQWQQSADGFSWTNAIGGSGATSTSYTTPNLTTTTYYRAEVKSGVCSFAYSNVVGITVGNFDPGTITASDIDLNLCIGELPGRINGTFAIYSSPIILIGYQWQSSTDGINYSNIAGATLVYYDPPVISANIWYRRVVNVTINGKPCSAFGNEIALNAHPVPTLAPIAPISNCEGSAFTITAVGGNLGSGTPVYTIASTNPSSPMPAVTTNSNGVFFIDPNLSPNTPVVGVHNYTVSVAGGNTNGCSASQTIEVTIYSTPYITLTASCAENNDGTVKMTGTLAYPVGGVIEYQLYNGSTPVSGWVTNPVFPALTMGIYTVYARNAAYPSCQTYLSDEILGRTVDVNSYHVCQDDPIVLGDGMQATSQCYVWSGTTHTFPEICSDASQTYRVSNNNAAPRVYSQGNLVQYAILATFKPQTTSILVKDCKTKPSNATYSVYKYPFNPNMPGNNFIEWVPSVCPTGGKVEGLVPGTVYVLVINSPDASTQACSDPWFTGGDKVQMATTIGDVYWYLNEGDTSPIYVGPVFDPTKTAGTGITGTEIPGTWTFWTGCFSGTCRQPVEFVVDPLPIVVASNLSVCSGKTTNIQLASKDDLGRIIDPTTVTYTWTASNFSGTATGFSDCTSGCGSIINQTLTASTSCPIVRYMVTATVNGCKTGEAYPVDVTVIDSPAGSHPKPAIPADATYSCLSQVPAPSSVTLTHSCVAPMTVIGVDTNMGGTGCPSSPRIIHRTWTFTDACETTIATQIITIIDDVAPTFTKPDDITIYTDASCSYGIHPSVTGDVIDEADNCSSGLEATYKDSDPVVGLCNTTIIRTWSLVDKCGNAAVNQMQTITITDKIIPVLADPPSKSFCVEDILQATYDGQLGADADIIASYNPLYEPDPDILLDRPDYYIIDGSNTDLNLNPATYFSDNCSPVNQIILHWSLTDVANQPVKDGKGNNLTDIKMQVSNYLTSNNTYIKLNGAQTADINYIITYWLEDLCNKESAKKTATISVKPRPQMNKTF